MGGSKSKVNAESGTLNGAYAPSLAGVTIPPQPDGKKTFQATVPKGKGLGGQMMGVFVHGSSINVLIPVGKKVGDTFRFTLTGNIHQVIASTLNEVPGMEIAQAKPIIWGSVSHAFRGGHGNAGQQSMGKMVGRLMQEAQGEILQQAIDVGCNAVLGMVFNVTNDSSGEHGNNKMVIVTACGTPCSLVPTAEAPIMVADVYVEPLYNA
jgi:uncharacterized protein YbjQ (UPF0145 family)